VTKALKLLRDLVALPSVNPAFLPDGDPRAGEARVADYLAAVAAKAGLAVEFQPVQNGRANLVARYLPSHAATRRILLAPHLDTVPEADAGQFLPQIKDDRLYGRGACDTKGSVAAMLTALQTMVRGKDRPRKTEIIFAGLVDEEFGQAGSRRLADSGLKADLAIIGEPTRLRVVTAHKGDAWLELRTRGKAAHGARPELGRNAVMAMAEVVRCLEIDYALRLRARRHPLLGTASVNVGCIHGGTQPNIVPDHCAIKIDRRYLPGETEAGIRREIRLLLRSRGLSAELLEAKAAPCPPMETNPALPLVRQLMRTTGCELPAGADFFCDAAIIAARGTPAVVFGPGDIAQAHTASEWISLAQLENATRILTRFLSAQP